MGKTHFKKFYDPNYLGAYAIEEGEEPIYTIKAVKREKLTLPNGDKDDATVVYFKEKKAKPLVLNVTNAKTIKKIYGTPYIEDWVGKKIQLYVTKVKAFGELTDAVRIRPRKPKVKKPTLTTDHKKYSTIVRNIKKGDTDVKTVADYFNIPKKLKSHLEELESSDG